MPTTWSSPMRRMPFTPLELRPMGRASDSLKRMAMPRAVESTSSSPGLVTTTSTSSSPSRSLMAMMPPFIGRLYASRGVFFTRPRAVAMTRKWSADVEVADRAAVGDLLALGEVQQVDHGPAAAVAGQLRQVVDLAPVDLALVGEEEQIGVRAGDEEVLDGVFFFGLGAVEALAAAVLGPVGRGGRPLDVAVAADRDHHGLFGDEVFEVDDRRFLRR